VRRALRRRTRRVAHLRGIVSTIAGALLALGASPQTRAVAAAPTLQEPQFAKAAVLVTLADRLAADCASQRGHTPEERARLDEWAQRNRLDRVRAHLANLAQQPSMQALHRSLLDGVDRQMSSLPADRCIAALALSRVPDAQLAATMPDLLARLPEVTTSAPAPADAPKARSAQSPESASSRSPPGATPASLAALQREIDSFGFDSRAAMGIGGFLTMKTFPIVLFRDGTALLEIEALARPAELAAHRRANPDDWTRWRRAGGELQLERRGKDGTAWQKLYFQATYPRLPDDFRLDGRYRSLAGVGNVAVGGTDSVAAFQEYTFAPDGRVLRGGGAGATATGGDFSVATASVAPARRGRYRIDGLLLAIDWDDGSRESRLIVADPKDPKTAIWLDGTGYVRR